MCRWIWIVVAIVLIVFAVGALRAAEPEAKALAQKGYSTFREVLSGDEAKLPSAILDMEAARKADETDVPDIGTPGRLGLTSARAAGDRGLMRMRLLVRTRREG